MGDENGGYVSVAHGWGKEEGDGVSLRLFFFFFFFFLGGG